MEYINTIKDIFFWIFRNIFWINILLAILLVFVERRNPTTTMLWLMVLLFVPGVGFLIYLFLGQDMSKSKMFKLKQNEDLLYRDKTFHQFMDIKSEKISYKDLDFEEQEDIIEMHILSSSSYFSQDNEVELFFDGKEKFKAMLESFDKAKEYIYVQYYIVKTDGLGKKVFEKLIEKAKEGIEVKLLVDGMGGRFIDKNYIEKLREAGGEVEIFFPTSIIPLRINYRNHRKICIVDGREGYVGGFNIGDEYLGLDEKFGYWRDTHVKIKGTAINGLQWRFFKDWRFAAKSKHVTTRVDIPEDEFVGNAGIQIVSSGPDSNWPSIKDGYLKMITNARDRIYIQSPYFIPDDSIFEALRVAGLSGIDVRVMFPNKPDHPFVYWAGMSYMGELLEAGVKFYTYEKGFLHAKMFLMDDIITSIGTANLDIRSFELNFEVNAFIYDKDVNKEVAEQFILDLEDCEEMTLAKYDQRSNIVKIKESVSRLLSPIL